MKKAQINIPHLQVWSLDNLSIGISGEYNVLHRTSFHQNILHDIEDEEISNSDQIALRQFGYNTIEVIA